MATHDKARRAFLIQTATGMGAAAATGLLPGAEAEAQSAAKAPATAMTMSAAKPEAPKKAGEGSGAFFNITDSVTIAAIAERIMPGAPGKPGATDADVFNYIDLALAGAYSDQQEFYRHGLTQLDAYCKATYQKSFPRFRLRSRTKCSRLSSPAKPPASTGRMRSLSSIRCARTRWRACSLIRFTVAIGTSSAGASSDSRGRSSNSRRTTSRAKINSRASRSSACNPNHADGRRLSSWLHRRQTS